jgi:hypothetical protein
MSAQEPSAPSGEFYGPLVPKAETPKFFQRKPGGVPLKLAGPLPANALRKPAISRCAVPLIEMQARKDIDSAIQFTPRVDRVDPIPQAKLPPACEAPSTR